MGYTDLKEFVEDISFKFHRISFLVIILILYTAFHFTLIDNLFQRFNFVPTVLILTWLGATILLVLFWYWKRTTLPKVKKGKKSIVIAITTENNNQKIRIAKDFSNEIRRQLRKNDLEDSFEVVVLHNYLSTLTARLIGQYIKYKKHDNSFSKELKSFENLINKLNAKFIVYGELIKRNSPNNTYNLSLDGLIIHSKLNESQSQIIQEDFNKVWQKEISFLEENELNEFKNNANDIFFAATYMIGLTTFADNRFELGIKIWEKLQDYIITRDKLKTYKTKILQLLEYSLSLNAELLFLEGKLKESIRYRDKLHKISTNSYGELLHMSIKYYTEENNIEQAIKCLEEAESISNGDGTWRYNKLYLLCKDEKFSEAVVVIGEIISNHYDTERNTCMQVLSFNQFAVSNNPNDHFSYFIIGFVYLKKLNRPLDSYEFIEEFINRTSTNNKYVPLLVEAEKFLIELNSLLNIKKKSK